jgi:hypothetical protein
VPPGDYAYVDREGLDTGSAFEERLATAWGPTAAPEATHDLTGVLLPGYATIPQFDAASHAVTWTPGTGDGSANFAFAWIVATRGTSTWTWQVAAPYTAGAVTYPVLPAGSDFDYNIAPGDATHMAYTAGLAVAPETLAGVRGAIFATDDSSDLFDAIRVGSAGQLFVVECDSGEQCKQ